MLNPVGIAGNSPAIYRWEKMRVEFSSLVETAEIFSRSYGTLCTVGVLPSDKSLGYFQSSLRDSSSATGSDTAPKCGML
jgi:hypothetical protein